MYLFILLISVKSFDTEWVANAEWNRPCLLSGSMHVIVHVCPCHKVQSDWNFRFRSSE